jgi:hypothetical protein
MMHYPKTPKPLMYEAISKMNSMRTIRLFPTLFCLFRPFPAPEPPFYHLFV